MWLESCIEVNDIIDVLAPGNSLLTKSHRIINVDKMNGEIKLRTQDMSGTSFFTYEYIGDNWYCTTYLTNIRVDIELYKKYNIENYREDIIKKII